MRLVEINKTYEAYGLEQLSWYISTFQLKPHHTFLDIGCGVGSGAIHFVKYLDDGKYYGFDKEELAIQICSQELNNRNLSKKNPTLWHTLDFDLEPIDTIDFALAYSVMTHIDSDYCRDLLTKLKAKAHSKTKVVFTYFNTHPLIQSTPTYGLGSTHEHRMTGKEYQYVVYNDSYIEKLCQDIGWKVQFLGPSGPHGHHQEVNHQGILLEL